MDASTDEEKSYQSFWKGKSLRLCCVAGSFPENLSGQAFPFGMENKKPYEILRRILFLGSIAAIQGLAGCGFSDDHGEKNCGGWSQRPRRSSRKWPGSTTDEQGSPMNPAREPAAME